MRPGSLVVADIAHHAALPEQCGYTARELGRTERSARTVRSEGRRRGRIATQRTIPKALGKERGANYTRRWEQSCIHRTRYHRREFESPHLGDNEKDFVISELHWRAGVGPLVRACANATRVAVDATPRASTSIRASCRRSEGFATTRVTDLSYVERRSESFFATLKTELVHGEDWHTRDEARSSLFEYIEVWYNRMRRHSTLDYKSPVQYELERMQKTKAA